MIAFQRIDTSNDIVAALRVLHEDPRNFVKFEELIDGIVLRLSIGSWKSKEEEYEFYFNNLWGQQLFEWSNEIFNLGKI